MTLVVIITIVLYAIAIAWTWQSLAFLENEKKIGVICIGVIGMLLIALVMFYISKSGVNYATVEIEKSVRNILVLLFAGLNSVIILPQIGRVLGKIYEDEITKEQASKRFIIIFIILILLVIFECGYMKSTQEGILKVYDAMQQ